MVARSACLNTSKAKSEYKAFHILCSNTTTTCVWPSHLASECSTGFVLQAHTLRESTEYLVSISFDDEKFQDVPSVKTLAAFPLRPLEANATEPDQKFESTASFPGAQWFPLSRRQV